ncbi:MAG: archease [Myxococcota bacterium]
MSERGSFDFVEGATADLSLVARGPSAAAVFHAAAEALATVTVEHIDAVEPRVSHELEMRDTELDLLLLRFLNELIYLRDADGLVLRPRNVRVKVDGGPALSAELAGETLDAERHGLGLEVKAATVYGLRIQPTDEGWEASVTLDV